MARYNVKELTGQRLGYALAQSLGAVFRANSIGAVHAYVDGHFIGGFVTRTERGIRMPDRHYRPSQYVEQGHGVVAANCQRFEKTASGWLAWVTTGDAEPCLGATLLEAGVRALVYRHCGPEVEIPDNIED